MVTNSSDYRRILTKNVWYAKAVIQSTKYCLIFHVIVFDILQNPVNTPWVYIWTKDKFDGPIFGEWGAYIWEKRYFNLQSVKRITFLSFFLEFVIIISQKSAKETPEQHCVKYTQIRAFSDLYFFLYWYRDRIISVFYNISYSYATKNRSEKAHISAYFTSCQL